MVGESRHTFKQVLHTEKHMKNSTENGFTVRTLTLPSQTNLIISSLFCPFFCGQWVRKPQRFDAFYSNHLDPLCPKLAPLVLPSLFLLLPRLSVTFACGEAHQSSNYTAWKTNTPPKKLAIPKKGNSSSNHHFSDVNSLLVSGNSYLPEVPKQWISISVFLHVSFREGTILLSGKNRESGILSIHFLSQRVPSLQYSQMNGRCFFFVRLKSKGHLY